MSRYCSPSSLTRGEAHYHIICWDSTHSTSFVPTAALYAACERRHIPRELLVLLSKLINVDPNLRPTAERVRTTLRGLVSRVSEGQLISTDKVGKPSSISFQFKYVDQGGVSGQSPEIQPGHGIVYQLAAPTRERKYSTSKW